MAFNAGSGAIIRLGIAGAGDTTRQINGVGDSLNRVSNAARSAFASIASTVGIGFGISELIKLSDEYTKSTAQIKLATTSQREYAIAIGDVSRIAKVAQADLGATGVLYARIANGTRELGLAQSKVADITETVNLALKVSGATTAESASAMLQLSQSFASGTLRGEEFNAVNEAAPRLMKALADGMGVPIGALKQMATDGKITSAVMSQVLPKALAELREEAKSVQTISGAFTGLRNEVLQFVGTQSQASGAVSALTGSIGILANNLGLLSGAMLTLVASKIGSWLSGLVTQTYASFVANRLLVTSNLAAAQSHAAATGATLALTTARVAELRAAVLAASGDVALTITLNGLIPAQAKAALAAEAHAAALAAQTTAMGAASVAGGILRGALAFLGGPIGAIITLLGLGATAWMVWGNKAKEANETASESALDASTSIIAELDKQIAKHKAIIAMRNGGATLEQANKNIKSSESLKALGLEIADINNGAGKYAGTSSNEKFFAREKVLKRILEITTKVQIEESKGIQAAALTNGEARLKFMGDYTTKQEQLIAKLAEGRKLLGAAFTPADEARIRAHYAEKTGGAAKAQAAINKEASAYATLTASVHTKIEEAKLELALGGNVTEAQKIRIKLDQDIAAGRVKMSPILRAALDLDIEALSAAQQAQKYSEDEAAFYAEQAEAKFDASSAAIKAATDEADSNELLARTFGMTKTAIEQMELARLEEQRAQIGNVGMITEEIAKLDALIAAKKRNIAAVGSVDTKQAGADQSKRLGVDIPGEFGKIEDPFNDFGSTLRATFDSAGDGLQKMADAMGALASSGKNYEKEMLVISDLRATKDPGNMATALKNEQKLIEKTKDDQINAYANMAGAAKGYFDEKSDAYRLLNGLEMAMHAFQMANMAEKLFTSLFVSTATATGVVAGQAIETGAVIAGQATQNAAKVPGVFMSFMSALGPWGAAAAAVAIAAVLGGGGGGGAPTISMDAFAAQKANDGSGGVLGDKSAQSESIQNSLSALEGFAKPSLLFTSQMVTLLRSINTNLSGATNSLLQSGFDAFGSDFKGSSKSSGGGIIGAIFGSSSSSSSLSDLGLAFANQTIAAAMQSIELKKYQVTRTDKSSSGFLGFGSSSSTSYNTQMSAVDDKVARSMTLATQQMFALVEKAAGQIGASQAQIEALKNIDTGLGKVSLNGKTGQEIEELLTAVFSKMGDAMATVIAPGVADMQKAGEGYLETLVRVTNGLSITNTWSRIFGRSLLDVSIQGAKAANQLADAFGDLETLNESSQAFYESYYTQAEQAANSQLAVSEALAAVNLSMPQTKLGLRDLANSLDLSTESGRTAYATLLSLAPEFADTADLIQELAKDASEKLMEAFTGRGQLMPALDTTSLKTLLLKDTLVSTYTAAGNISTLFLNVNSGLITFGTRTTALTGGLTGAQLAADSLQREIVDLGIGASGTVIDIAGLSNALANVNTETFVATMGLVFENLANRISGVIDSIGAERIAVREAALQIINPTVMSKYAIERGIGGINTNLPSNAGVVAANAKLKSTDASVAYANSQKAQVAASLASSSAWYDARINEQKSSYSATLASAKTDIASFYKMAGTYGMYVTQGNYGNGNRKNDAFKMGSNERLAGWGRTNWPSGHKTADGFYKRAQPLISSLYGYNSVLDGQQSQINNAINDKNANTAWYAAREKNAIAAQAAALAQKTAAETAAKTAQLAYAAALQNFAIDASKSVSKLSKLREETVKYYEAQKQLADLMTTSAAGLRGTVADYRYSQLSDAQQFDKLQANYAQAYAMALSTDGETLAGYGNTINSALNPLLEKARSVLSDSAYNSFAATTLARAETIAGRLETLTPTNYAADSLTMLGQIDSTLAVLDASSRSAEKIISDAVNAGSDKTAGGLRAVIAALTGKAIPAFAAGGDFGGGLRIVGENGPELEATGASRIFNASQTRNMLGGAGNTARLEALVERQTQELSDMRAELRAIASSNAKLARLADRNEINGVLVRTDSDTPLNTVAA